jgi:protoheme IX farnesyltransferase
MSTAIDSRQGPSKPLGFAGTLQAYFDLTKPRIIGLLLVTTYATMLIAGGEQPTWSLIFYTLLGGFLTSGSANAINMVYDQDIDRIMRRTQWRPIPSGRVSPRNALIFAIALGILGVVELAYFVNPLSAALAAFGNFFYVFIYTMWLKRSTVQNIVIGGAAGAVPPLVGWAAVTGTVNWAAFILFMIIFLWTPPHFWALALYKNDDYKAANIPMMPAVLGKDTTIRQMILYCGILLPVSLLLVVYHPMTIFYFLTALLLGAGFAYFGVKVARDRSDRSAKQMFAYSLVYLALIFGAMVVDRVVLADFMRPMYTPTGVNGYAIDLSRKLTVSLGGSADEALSWTVVPSKSSVSVHPNEVQKLVYRVTNRSNRTITAMADHDIQPERAAGFFKKIDCFCFKEQTIGPGETVELPLVFSFVDALPQDISTISVHYRFKEMAAEDKHDHDHPH